MKDKYKYKKIVDLLLVLIVNSINFCRTYAITRSPNQKGTTLYTTFFESEVYEVVKLLHGLDKDAKRRKTAWRPRLWCFPLVG